MRRLPSLLALIALLAAACGERSEPVAPAPPERTAVYLANFSAEPVLAFYLREAGSLDWGDNLLRGEVWGGNWYYYVTTVDSGYYDARIEGDSRVIEQLNAHLVGAYLSFAYNTPVAKR